MKLEVKETSDTETVRELFVEYSHIKGAESCFVSFDKELNDLSGYYSGGAILVGFEDDKPVACVAIRKISDEKFLELVKNNDMLEKIFNGFGKLVSHEIYFRKKNNLDYGDIRENILNNEFVNQILFDEKNQPKYINSRETALYHKNEVLFKAFLKKVPILDDFSEEDYDHEKSHYIDEPDNDLLDTYIKENTQNGKIKLLRRYYGITARK